MATEVRVLEASEADVLGRVAPGVFDDDVDPGLAAEFLADPRHHLAVAIDAGIVVGMASGVHYIHPDKPNELWINEVGVSPDFRNQRLGRRLLEALLQRARELGCSEAWVLTDRSNPAAMRMYASLGGVEAPQDQVMFTFRLSE